MFNAKKVGDHRLCVVGDSFTLGYGDPTCLGWVGRISAEAIQKGYDLTVYNLGIRRDTSREIAARWEQESDARLKFYQGQAYIIFSFGVNDTTIEPSQNTTRIPFEESIKNFQHILTQAKKRYAVFFVGPPPVEDPAQNERIRILDQAFNQAAILLEIPYFSVVQSLLQEKIWMREVACYDGAHPQAAGYAVLAHLIGHAPFWWFQ